MSTMRPKVSLRVLALVIVLAAAPLALAQGEAGFGAGGSFYLNRSVTAPAGKADVGFKPGFEATAWLGQTITPLIGGEVRYMYEYNEMKLNGGGFGEYTFSGQSHAIHYDLLIHGAETGAGVRPFVAIGGGVKGYYGTGKENAFQPGQNYAILTKTSEWKPLIVVGGGIKFQVGEKATMRVEVYDYFTPAPEKVITPGPGAKLGGWFHNLVPGVGVSFTF